ncbi:uncharacterized protein MELLADRAFT_104354 [Melampsora larici-populina 98AG31]|uniref:Uncharacterized protein n=1 Tax=Melampsora larici-populina (strain 98AG31 / pathotype 3-4-7) TaxID=747676 RepID=F4REF0_MELLP|nr:uncharacterized protein MELLADRAFT_104354 [Melampsora larici-populina 98AG31]EGG09079.1 hypothetical protein MELLADRAFT_104354 [Melampsora larici-populina 98AG31]
MTIRPNHHYALHIPDQMRRWGPLSQVAEFAAEMDRTMLRRFCQLQRLLGDHAIDDHREKNRIQLRDEQYEALLVHVRKTIPDTRDHRHIPHPAKSKVLHTDAVPKPSYKVSKFISVSVLKPNNCIKYKEAGKSRYAMVRQIYQFTDPVGSVRTELWVNPIENLFSKDLDSPSKNFRYLLHLMKCVLGKVEDHCIFVSPAKVVAVAAYRLLPDNTLSVAEGGIMLLPYDYKSQNEDM